MPQVKRAGLFCAMCWDRSGKKVLAFFCGVPPFCGGKRELIDPWEMTVTPHGTVESGMYTVRPTKAD